MIPDWAIFYCLGDFLHALAIFGTKQPKINQDFCHLGYCDLFFYYSMRSHCFLTVSYPINKFSLIILGYAVFKHSDLLEKIDGSI